MIKKYQFLTLRFGDACDHHCRKLARQTEFKSWMIPFAFHSVNTVAKSMNPTYLSLAMNK